MFRSYVSFAIHIAASVFHRQFAKERTVDDRVREYGEVVRHRLASNFHHSDVSYPPVALALIAFKREKVLEVYAAGHDGTFRFIRSYPILAASGRLGPKLQEGDQQVPEGLYRIESLNPNSLFHLALRVNYPNEYDRTKAAAESRENLGGDIMIHGNAASIGCLAMGDSAVEDLFVLAALTGIKNIRVVLSPIDFRAEELPVLSPEAPCWLESLYKQIKSELQQYPRPNQHDKAIRIKGSG